MLKQRQKVFSLFLYFPISSTPKRRLCLSLTIRDSLPVLISLIYRSNINYLYEMLNNLISQASEMERHGIPNDFLQNIDPIALISLDEVVPRLGMVKSG